MDVYELANYLGLSAKTIVSNYSRTARRRRRKGIRIIKDGKGFSAIYTVENMKPEQRMQIIEQEQNENKKIQEEKTKEKKLLSSQKMQQPIKEKSLKANNENKQSRSKETSESDPISEEKWTVCYLSNKYEVSDQGRIRKTDTHVLLNGTLNPRGYHCISIHSKNYFAHRIIYRSWHPEQAEEFEDSTIDHINGIRSDNRLENLRLVSNLENISKMMINRAELNIELTRIIQIYGYQGTLELLQQIN